MQLLYETSDESPAAQGLGLFSGKVKMLENAPESSSDAMESNTTPRRLTFAQRIRR